MCSPTTWVSLHLLGEVHLPGLEPGDDDVEPGELVGDRPDPGLAVLLREAKLNQMFRFIISVWRTLM
jgi:hypothetical protein